MQHMLTARWRGAHRFELCVCTVRGELACAGSALCFSQWRLHVGPAGQERACTHMSVVTRGHMVAAARILTIVLSASTANREAGRHRPNGVFLLSRTDVFYSRDVFSPLRGRVGTPFSREKCGAPRFARVPLTLAHLLLFHRRLDGYLPTTRG